MNEHIREYLEYYINLKNPQYAVLLKGRWGSGKTFFIKNCLEKWVLKENDKDDNETEETIEFKPIYISLFGLNNISQINEKIRAEIHPFLYSKAAKIGKNVLQGLFKFTTKIDLDLNQDKQNDGNISYTIDLLGLFKDDKLKIKGNKILIFDDIERCKITIEEIFGYINYFVEHLNCKVIIVCDEDKIKLQNLGNNSNNNQFETKESVDNSYIHFKEKLIGQTFEVKAEVENALNTFYKEILNLSCKDFLIENKNMMIELFNISEKDNLRILRQLICDFNRFLEFIDESRKTNEKYYEFLKHLLVYFMIVYLEFKSGNKDISDYQKSNYFDKSEKEKTEKYIIMYNPFLHEHHIQYSEYILPIHYIIQYIETGYVDKEDLNGILKQNNFFRLDKEQEWERLWNWRYIKDEEFNELRDKVWSQFYHGKLDNILQIIHTTGIFISLYHEKLIKKKLDFILKHSKKLIIMNLNLNNELVRDYQNGLIYRPSGKQYQSYESPELLEILNFTEDEIRNRKSANINTILKKLFENINDTTIDNIYHIIKDSIPGSDIQIPIPIFKIVNGKKLGRKLKLLNYFSIAMFKEFIHSIYYPEERYTNIKLQNYHKEDLNCLIDCKNEINSDLKKREVLKNRLLNELNIELEKLIEKIQAL